MADDNPLDELAKLREQNAALLRANEELGEFAYTVSHDLKEPLRGLRNYAVQLIQDYGDQLDVAGLAKLETLKRLSERLEDLVNSLLRFSRAGRVDIALQPTDLNEVVAQVVDSVRVSLREQGGVEVRLPKPLPTVPCDGARISQVFLNLITNAAKYNDKQDKWVEIGTDEALGDPPVFYVRDNGIGIREEHFDAIFRVFRRLHGREKFGGGVGVGLAIAKKIIERHHGYIWVKSTLGEGTTFYFTLQQCVPK